MPRVNFDEVNKYQSSANGEWLSLKDDGDVARVQFLFNTVAEIPVFAVHKVDVGGKERYVNCLREYSDPLEMCPLCAAGLKVHVVRFMVMYDHEDGKVKMWERGTTFVTRVQGLMNRYTKLPFSSYVFEIERHGRAGDMKTKYEIYPMDGVDGYDVSDVDFPEFLGGLIIDATEEDQETYLRTGDFPSFGDNQPTQPQAPVGRRVPASNQQSAPRQAPIPRRSAATADAESTSQPSSRRAAPTSNRGQERF